MLECAYCGQQLSRDQFLERFEEDAATRNVVSREKVEQALKMAYPYLDCPFCTADEGVLVSDSSVESFRERLEEEDPLDQEEENREPDSVHMFFDFQ